MTLCRTGVAAGLDLMCVDVVCVELMCVDLVSLYLVGVDMACPSQQEELQQ